MDANIIELITCIGSRLTIALEGLNIIAFRLKQFGANKHICAIAS